MTPVRAPAVDTFNPVDISWRVPPLLPIITLPLAEASVVAAVDVRVVNAAVDAIVVPIAVLFKPVEVMLKLLLVMVSALAPVLMLDALRPLRARAPLVPVILTAPVVTVNPLAIVREPVKFAAELMV